jgi:hypothetical protein
MGSRISEDGWSALAEIVLTNGIAVLRNCEVAWHFVPDNMSM